MWKDFYSSEEEGVEPPSPLLVNLFSSPKYSDTSQKMSNTHHEVDAEETVASSRRLSGFVGYKCAEFVHKSQDSKARPIDLGSD